MHYRFTLASTIVAALMIAASGSAHANEKTPDKAAVDKAFDVLKTYDYGTDRNSVMAIDDACVAAHGNAEATKELEKRLAAVLSTNVSNDAKDYVCRRLRIIGSNESIPAIAPLLENKDLSHIARYALELNPSPEAGKALLDALPKVKGELKIGVIGSLASRADAASAAAIANELNDSDKAVARAAAHALGGIGDEDAAKHLGEFLPKAPADVKSAVTDADFECAEKLLKAGKKGEAITIYKSLMGEGEPKHVKLAATHGLLIAAGKKD